MVPREEINLSSLAALQGCQERGEFCFYRLNMVLREVYLGFRLPGEGLDRAVQANAGAGSFFAAAGPDGYTVGIKDPSG